jgi:metalloendopeptidase OMA1, mitochondrial
MRDLRRPLASLVLVASVLVSCETVPITGRSQLNLLSEPDEVQMGVQAYKEVVGKAKVSGDPVANAQVTRVAQRIIAVSEKPDLPWEVKVIDENQANAFALPGGKIAVYTGILPITRDDAGLAAVIGHEVGHVLARHSAERVSQQMVTQGLGGALVSGVLGTDPQTSQMVAGLFAQGLMLPWGRKQESEADHIGIILMAKAGYDPHAARDLWVRMAEASKGSSRPPEFLSTHPSEETRIRQIEAWLPEAMKYYRPPR